MRYLYIVLASAAIIGFIATGAYAWPFPTYTRLADPAKPYDQWVDEVMDFIDKADLARKGVGYIDVQCISITGQLCPSITSTDLLIESISFIPVDNIIGLPIRAI